MHSNNYLKLLQDKDVLRIVESLDKKGYAGAKEMQKAFNKFRFDVADYSNLKRDVIDRLSVIEDANRAYYENSLIGWALRKLKLKK